MVEAFQMGEAVKPTEETPPENLYAQLAEISGYIFDDTKPPFHSSYDNWHVFGFRTGPRPIVQNGVELSGPYLVASATPVNAAVDKKEQKKKTPVVARISSHTLRLEREFHIVNMLMQKSDPQCQRVVRPLDLIYLPASGLIVSIFESPGPNYLGGIVNLTNATPNEPIPLPLFLDFAVGACECLELLSSENIVHGEIRGDAFHFNKENGAVKLINFGSGPRSFDHGLNNAIWSSVSKQVGIIDKLFFISPEQTGRMPAPPDSRTDIYSTGILFYTILTNQLVFDVGSPMEVVQSVLTRRVPLAHTRRMDVPETLSYIIQKMTAKQIDDRYHSASGLKHDLLEVKRRMATGDLDGLREFRIGTRDTTSVFTLPATMVGRRAEQEDIVRIIEKASRVRKASLKNRSRDFNESRTPRGTASDGMKLLGVEDTQLGDGGFGEDGEKACNVIAIVGSGGMGKSSLVTNVLVEARRRGYFASAKFDQSHKSPFAPVLRVINSIFEQVLTESEEVVRDFYVSVYNAFQQQSLPLHKMKMDLPALEYIINAAPQITRNANASDGPQTPLATSVVKRGLSTRLPSGLKTETQKTKTPEVKFNVVSLEVLRILARSKFVCLWLDDLQFADDESLQLISNIVASNMQVTLMLTYRPGELMADKLKGILDSERANVTIFELGPLHEEDVIEYVSLTMYRPKEAVIPLVAVIQAKAGGNPFYMREMLNMLHRKGCLPFNRALQIWQYDLDLIFRVLESDSPTDMLDNAFIVRRLQELPKDARIFLAWSSLLGTMFSFKYVKKLLAHVTGENEVPPDVVNGLQSAIQACIVVATDDEDLFRFSHDRYLQAAGELQERENQAAMHLSIAKMMMTDDEATVDFYARCDHICQAIKLLKDQYAVREPFRKAILRAAKSAAETGAYRAAVRYFGNAIALLQDDPWNDKPDCNYHETMELYTRLAESQWHIGDEMEALRTLSVIFSKARHQADAAKPSILQGRIYRQIGQLKKALDSFVTALSLRGVPVEENLTMVEIDKEFWQLHGKLNSTKGMALLQVSQTASKPMATLAYNYAEAISTAFWVDHTRFCHLICRLVNLFLDEGFFPHAGIGLSYFASIAASRHRLVEFACRVGDQAYLLIQQSGDALVTARSLVTYSHTIRHLQVPLSTDLIGQEEASRQVAALGDRAQAVLSMAFTASSKLFCTKDLHEVRAYCRYAITALPGFNEEIDGGTILLGLKQLIEALIENTDISDAHTVMTTPDHDSEDYALKKVGNNDVASFFYGCFKVMALYLFGYYEEAKAEADKNMRVSGRLMSIRFSRLMAFFHALASIAVLRINPKHPDYEAILNNIIKDKEMLEDFVKVSGDNYYMWVQVISAELFDLQCAYDKAAKCYELALDHCENGGFALDEALASELAARSYHRRGLKRVARAFVQEAIRGYTRLGATAKANQLLGNFEGMLAKMSKVPTADSGCQTDTVLRDLIHHAMPDTERTPNIVRVPEAPPNRSRDHSKDRPPKTRSDSFLSDTEDTAAQSSVQKDGQLAHFTLDALDLNSIIKSSQVISSEVDMNILLTRMCEIVLDSAGSQADLAAIVVKESDQYVVSAMGGLDIGVQSFKPGVPVEKKEMDLSKPVIFYVLRTRKNIFLHNLIEDERFSNPDKAWMEKNPGSKSVIALPIIHETLLGVLYVEGMVDSFTDRNLVVLSYLTSQIGISIKNALLFQRVRNISLANHALIESQKQALQNAKESEKRAKQATEEAIKMMKLKEDASKAKSEFLANVSHELRTPLSGVIGLTELLRDTNMTSEQQELSDSIRLCADTLLTVINDILDFSKIEAGKMRLSIVGFDIEETIRDAIRALAKANVTKTDLKVVENIHLGFKAPVYGDPVRLRQVLMNVLSNSFKFCPHGSIEIKAVREEETQSSIRVLISVKDTGIGIDDYTIKLLFTPFSQADTSTARRYGGTGLGLSICKHLVEMMGGKIWMESAVGKGTTVYFTLTLTKASPSGSALILPQNETQHENPYVSVPTMIECGTLPQEPSTSALGTTANDENHVGGRILTIPKNERFRVLIAEDNPINQKIAVSFVERMDMTVKAVGNGVEALDELREHAKNGEPYHLVLMDVQMPIMDGYEATKLLRQDELTAVRNVTVIAMTASAIQGDKEKCLDVGMNDYLAKPVRSTTLKSKLERYLRSEGAESEPETNGDGENKPFDVDVNVRPLNRVDEVDGTSEPRVNGQDSLHAQAGSETQPDGSSDVKVNGTLSNNHTSSPSSSKTNGQVTETAVETNGDSESPKGGGVD